MNLGVFNKDGEVWHLDVGLELNRNALRVRKTKYGNAKPSGRVE